MKLMTVVGTRPEVIKLSEIIKKCDIYFEHILVHTGQNHASCLYDVFFDEFELRRPDYYLQAAVDNLGQTIANIIESTYNLMARIKPDALLILGDTNSTLCVIGAKRLKIPVFHLEAGNRCFDENLPEEINRRIVDHASDVNLCYTQHAKNYLYREGLPGDRVFVVGSPMAEVFRANQHNINNSMIVKNLSLIDGEYILLSAHREENIDNEKNFTSLVSAINALAQTYNMPVIYSAHPRSRKFIEQRKVTFHPGVRVLDPFGFSDYISLQRNAFCVVSDSGTLAEEASYYRFPAVSLRTSTERPEALEKGNFVIGSIHANEVLEAVKLAVELTKNHAMGEKVTDYQDENISVKVVKLIQSYTSIINQIVWRK